MFGKRKKVLVLEDETSLLDALCLKLDDAGFTAVPVDNGQDAVIESDAQEFDAAIIDLVVPRLDGFEVLAHIRSRNKEIPIIVASNLGQKEDIEEALSLGADRFFIKSNISLSEIVDEVKDIIEEKDKSK